ncbi:U3 small nucleolar ribonucleoprotein IMP4 [Merluccius polli]|uniref:U3 small nucleolar ribonucleoprotein IMP4 n=1 Tax=Merluccius polli TaxID=89951 RepID=A0AA47MR38_MERPO|nr:U3 small nucleolar ribonucleoprotein IMP4 [Merluccius polli]
MLHTLTSTVPLASTPHQYTPLPPPPGRLAADTVKESASSRRAADCISTPLQHSESLILHQTRGRVLWCGTTYRHVSSCRPAPLLFPVILRREVRLRREYLYRKAQEDRERTIEDKKEKLKAALEENRLLPTEVRKDALQLQKLLEYDDEGAEGKCLIDL